MTARRIYLASSWRCAKQPSVLAELRHAGHEIYDFRNPAPGSNGFGWGQLDPDWQHWSPARYIELLAHPIAQAGYAFDKAALDWCDTCVLVLPCGRSAHLEAGYTIGQGKPTYFLLDTLGFEPELMYLLGSGCLTSTDALIAALAA